MAAARCEQAARRRAHLGGDGCGRALGGRLRRRVLRLHRQQRIELRLAVGAGAPASARRAAGDEAARAARVARIWVPTSARTRRRQ